MRHFYAILTAALSLAASTAVGATTVLGSGAPYLIDAAFLRVIGVENAGDIASTPGQSGAGFGPGVATDGGDLSRRYWAAGLAGLGNPTEDGVAGRNSPTSGNLVNQVLGVDGFASIFGADQPSSQTLVEIQDFDSASNVLDRFAGSLAQALGANKR